MKKSQNKKSPKKQGGKKPEQKKSTLSKAEVLAAETKIEPDINNYKKFSFWFPIAYAVISVVVIGLALYWASQGLTAQAGTIYSNVAIAASALTIMSPSALILVTFISIKHNKRYTKSSDFYRQAPFKFSFIVAAAQVLYLVFLSIKK
ncbi:MAG: hypothetical protein RR198_05290 [Oscillospiraceae bacterium]